MAFYYFLLLDFAERLSNPKSCLFLQTNASCFYSAWIYIGESNFKTNRFLKTAWYSLVQGQFRVTKIPLNERLKLFQLFYCLFQEIPVVERNTERNIFNQVFDTHSSGWVWVAYKSQRLEEDLFGLVVGFECKLKLRMRFSAVGLCPSFDGWREFCCSSLKCKPRIHIRHRLDICTCMVNYIPMYVHIHSISTCMYVCIHVCISVVMGMCIWNWLDYIWQSSSCPFSKMCMLHMDEYLRL